MEQRISIERLEQAINLFGSFDENIRLIESEFHVTVANREGELRVNGEPEDTMLAVKAINALLAERGLIDVDEDGKIRDYAAFAKSGGLSALVYMKNPDDAAAIARETGIPLSDVEEAALCGKFSPCGEK